MATYASRPAWELRGRVLGSVRVVAPLAVGALVIGSLLLRTRDFNAGFWIDEGLSVGIADRPLGDIPGVLRMDGSPPLYYMLLHAWMSVAGSSEVATHAFSLLTALVAVPVAWWAARALFGTRSGWIAAVLAATNPFLTQYAQETRMYSLVALLGLVACATFARTFAFTGTEAAAPAAARRPWAIGFAVSLAALLYTHNWAIFFAAGCGATWLGLAAAAPRAARRELVTDALIGFGGALVLYLPWVPTLLYQSAHTGAPWAQAPDLLDLFGVPGKLFGAVAQVGLFLAAGAGLAVLVERTDGRLGPRGRAVATLAGVWLGMVLLAFAASQLSPAWATRYLAIGLPPLLLLAAAGLAHAGRLGVVGLVVVALVWAGDGAPSEKSNVREIAESVGPSLAPGDLVVSTQPEQIPVLAHYLPDGLRYATLTGPVHDLGVTDWRDGVGRLRGSSAQHDLEPLLDALPSGRRVALVEPIVLDLGRWSAPWTELVRVRSTEWRQFVSNDPRLHVTAIRPDPTASSQANAVRATVLVKG
jgi:mannosyltransferase